MRFTLRQKGKYSEANTRLRDVFPEAACEAWDSPAIQMHQDLERRVRQALQDLPDPLLHCSIAGAILNFQQ